MNNVAADMAQPDLCIERIWARLLAEVRQQVADEWEEKCGRRRSLELAMSSAKGGGWGVPATTVSETNVSGKGWRQHARPPNLSRTTGAP